MSDRGLGQRPLCPAERYAVQTGLKTCDMNRDSYVVKSIIAERIAWGALRIVHESTQNRQHAFILYVASTGLKKFLTAA